MLSELLYSIDIFFWILENNHRHIEWPADGNGGSRDTCGVKDNSMNVPPLVKSEGLLRFSK